MKTNQELHTELLKDMENLNKSLEKTLMVAEFIKAKANIEFILNKPESDFTSSKPWSSTGLMDVMLSVNLDNKSKAEKVQDLKELMKAIKKKNGYSDSMLNVHMWDSVQIFLSYLAEMKKNNYKKLELELLGDK